MGFETFKSKDGTFDLNIANVTAIKPGKTDDQTILVMVDGREEVIYEERDDVLSQINMATEDESKGDTLKEAMEKMGELIDSLAVMAPQNSDGMLWYVYFGYYEDEENKAGYHVIDRMAIRAESESDVDTIADEVCIFLKHTTKFEAQDGQKRNFTLHDVEIDVKFSVLPLSEWEMRLWKRGAQLKGMGEDFDEEEYEKERPKTALDEAAEAGAVGDVNEETDTEIHVVPEGIETP